MLTSQAAPSCGGLSSAVLQVHVCIKAAAPDRATARVSSSNSPRRLLSVCENTERFSHTADMSRPGEGHDQEAGRIIIKSDLHTIYKVPYARKNACTT
jgi:hypothetical protein